MTALHLVGIESLPSYEQIVRERVFNIQSLREDKRDLAGQISVTILQLLEEGFIGSFTVNCGAGGSVSIQVKESQKIL